MVKKVEEIMKKLKVSHKPLAKNKRKELYIKALQGRAEMLNFIGKGSDALFDINFLITFLKREKNIQDLANAFTLKSVILGSCGQFMQIEKTIEKARDIFRKIEDKKGEASTLITSSYFYEITKEYQKAIKLCVSAIEILKKLKDEAEISNGYNNLGSIYHSMRDYEKALFYYKKALVIRRKINDKKGESESLNNIAFAYEDIHNYRDAFQYYNKSIKIRKEIGYKQGEGITLVNRGYLYKEMGYIEKAISNFIEGKSIFEKIGNERFLRRCCRYIAESYYILSNYEESIRYSEISLQIVKKLKNAVDIINSMKYIGLSYLEIGKYTLAKKYLNDALKVANAEDDKSIISDLLFGIVEVELIENSLKSAEQNLKKILEILNEKGLKGKVVYAFCLLGRLYMAKDKQKTASKYFQDSMKLLKNNDNSKCIGIGKAYYYYAKRLMKQHQGKYLKYLKEAEKIFKKIGAKGWIRKVEKLWEKTNDSR